jgi:hypothetical protein
MLRLVSNYVEFIGIGTVIGTGDGWCQLPIGFSEFLIIILHNPWLSGGILLQFSLTISIEIFREVHFQSIQIVCIVTFSHVPFHYPIPKYCWLLEL